MPRPKKKPEYDKNQIIKSLLQAISEYYLSSDDRNASLRQVAAEFDISHLKARKLLITAGVFNSDVCDEVNDLKTAGKTIPEIMKITGLGRASVHSYLPYTKVVYNAKELSLNAERLRKYRARQEAVKSIKLCIEEKDGELKDIVWNTLKLFENYVLYTSSNQKYKYYIYNDELLVKRKEEGISRATLEQALENALKSDRRITEPEQLGVSHAEYIFPLFKRLGIII